MPLDIVLEDARWSRLRGLKQHIAKAHVLALPKREAAQITSLLLSNDKAIKALNKLWRGKNKPTNVLSFPAAPAGRGGQVRGQPRPLGDVILAYETCTKEAKAAGKPLRDHALHLVVHGLLHLTGHDHMNDADAAKMERKEIRILAKLGISNPYVLNNKT